MTKNHYGKCHICGKEGKLTFEHIPPRKAFNWHGAKVYNGFGALSRSQGEAAKYFNSQQGMGKYTLCQSCNNNTGTWYAQAYCDFAMDVIRSLHAIKSLEHGSVVNFKFHDCPKLQIVKQVLAMFCSLLPISIVQRLGFDKLLLERDSNTINKELFDLRMYLTPFQNGQIMCGPTAFKYENGDSFETLWVADIGVYPFGFILNLTPKEPVDWGISIMDMFDAGYDEKCNFELSLMYLERTNNAFPLPLMFKELPDQQQ